MRELARRELRRPREISLHRRISIVCRGLVLRTTRARRYDDSRVAAEWHWLLVHIYVSHAAFVDPRELIQLAIQAVPCPRFLRTFLWTRRRPMLQLTYNRSCQSFGSLIRNNALGEENFFIKKKSIFYFLYFCLLLSRLSIFLEKYHTKCVLKNTFFLLNTSLRGRKDKKIDLWNLRTSFKINFLFY